jgi:CelD/BcsL family acetyltransferase involved in cellulose biosynthesis
MCSGELHIEIISDGEGLLRLRDHWKRLVKQDLGLKIFSSFEWVYAWWSEFSVNSVSGWQKRLHIVVVWRGGRVAAIAPLVIHAGVRGKLKIRKIEFAGTALADYQDLILETKALDLVSAIVRQLGDNSCVWDLVELRHIPEESVIPDYLEQALRSDRLPFRVRRETQCFFIPIDSDWKSYLGGRSRGTRKRFRNNANRLKTLEAQGVKVRVIDSPHTERDLLARMIALEQRKRVKGAPTLHMFLGTEHFYQRLIDVFGPERKLYVALMEKGEELIAYELGFRTGSTLLVNAKGFDSAFKWFSPGTMLIPAIFEYGFQSGLQEYDFGRGDEDYKKWLTKCSRRTLRFEIWNRAPSSRLAAQLYFRLRPRIYELRTRLRLGHVPRWEL